jgi:hypothetical protein
MPLCRELLQIMAFGLELKSLRFRGEVHIGFCCDEYKRDTQKKKGDSKGILRRRG